MMASPEHLIFPNLLPKTVLWYCLVLAAIFFCGLLSNFIGIFMKVIEIRDSKLREIELLQDKQSEFDQEIYEKSNHS